MTFLLSFVFFFLCVLSSSIKADFILINNDPLVPIGVWGTWQNKAQVKLLVREVLPAGGMTNIASSMTAGVTHLWITQNFGISGGSVFPMPQNNDCVYSIPSPDCAADNYLQSMSFRTNIQKLQPESWCYTPENIPSSLNITPSWFVTKKDLASTVVNSFANVGEVFEIEYSPLASPGTDPNANYNPEDTVFTGENRTTEEELSLGDQTEITGLDFTNKPLSNLMQYENVRIKTFSNCKFDGADMTGLLLDNKIFADCSFNGTKLVDTSLNNTQFSNTTFYDKTIVDFSGADLTGAFLVGAKITNGKFAGATLDRADFYSVVMKNSVFTGVKSWKGIDFTGGASFSGCTFSNVPFAGIKYDSTTNFSGAIMHGAIFAGTSSTSLSNWQGINLSGADLTGANFNYSNLTSAKLSESNLTDVNFSNANLTNALFFAGYGIPSTNCTRTKFIGATLTGADFTISNLTESNFENALLHGTKFNYSTMKNVAISKARYKADSSKKLAQANFDSAYFSSSTNLSGIDFSGLNFSQTTFSNCTMEKANFNSSNLSEVQFDHANLERATFKNATMSGAYFGIRKGSGNPTNLSNANFTGATIGAMFYYANLQSAIMENMKTQSGIRVHFENSIMKDVILTGSDFSKSSCIYFDYADLSKAYIDGVNFTGAEFYGAKLNEAYYDSKTKWSNGKSIPSSIIKKYKMKKK
ncbi:pentapeptide repeat-containing protein [bacterium]|jgi:uncharacterized protein YjbI with pentapeptide repeats|nr:pentapeptide repeat-containing protein [bacterium]